MLWHHCLINRYEYAEFPRTVFDQKTLGQESGQIAVKIIAHRGVPIRIQRSNKQS